MRRQPRAHRLCAAIFMIVLCAAGAARSAHAQVGSRSFISPLVTEDPNPSNELDLLPGWTRGENGDNFSFSFDLEKKLSQNTSIEFSDAINDPLSRRLRTTTGVSNLEVLAKWAFFKSDEHETRIAIGADVFLPTGQIAAGADGHPRGGPLLMFAKGMGDLSSEGPLFYLRPFAIQADAGYLPTWSGYESDIAQADATLSYSMPYLSASGARVGRIPIVSGLVPFIEFNYDQIIDGRSDKTPPEFLITPALAYQSQKYQLTVGGQFGLNGYAHSQEKSAVVGMVIFYLPQIFPAVRWTPF
ncbi:MAG: hypothetical protein ACYDC3_15695 [Candidatus Binataceae bacterium]